VPSLLPGSQPFKFMLILTSRDIHGPTGSPGPGPGPGEALVGDWSHFRVLAARARGPGQPRLPLLPSNFKLKPVLASGYPGPIMMIWRLAGRPGIQ
jgi:hypothetical protein